MQRDDHITMNIPIQIYARIIAFAMHEYVCTFWCWCWLKAQHKSDAIKMQNFSEKNNNLQYTKYSIMKCEHTFQIIVTWCAHPFCLYILKFQSNQTENSFETLYPSLQQFHWKVFIDSMRLFEMRRRRRRGFVSPSKKKMLKWGHTFRKFVDFFYWSTRLMQANELQRYLFAQPLQKWNENAQLKFSDTQHQQQL